MAELQAASNNSSSSGDNAVLVSDNVVIGADGNGEQLKEDKQAGEVNSEQKDKITETRDYSKDIYGRVPGKEPKYNIPCPICKRELATSRFAQHLEKCMGVAGRGVSSSNNNNGSQSKKRKSYTT